MRHDLFSTPLWHIEGTPQQLVEELYQGAYRFKEKYPSENRSEVKDIKRLLLIGKVFIHKVKNILNGEKL